MKQRKFLSLITAALFILVCTGMASALDKVDGYYQIGSEADLAEFRLLVNDGTETDAGGRLTANITLTGAWTPIGIYQLSDDKDCGYSGTFDGNGKTISGLTITQAALADSFWNNSARQVTGFFGVLNEGAVVRNLTIRSADIQIEGETTVAVMAGAVVGLNLGVIEHCRAEGGVFYNAMGNIGGIVGFSAGAESVVRDCSAADIQRIKANAESGSAAGVAATSWGSVQNCMASGIAVIEGYSAAGVVGTSFGDVQNCLAMGIGIIDGSYEAGGVQGSVSLEKASLKNSALLAGAKPTTISSDKFEGGVLGNLANGQEPDLSLVQDCIYPSNTLFENLGERPIGNILPGDMEPQYNVTSYDADAADLSKIPAVAAAFKDYKTSAAVEKGKTYTLDVTTLPGTAGDYTFAWASSSADVVTVSAASGATVTLTGVELGTANVTCTVSGDINAVLTCAVTVEPAAAVTGTPAGGVIYLDDKVELSYDFAPYTATDLDDDDLAGSGLTAAIEDGKVVLRDDPDAQKAGGTFSFDVELTGEDGMVIWKTVTVVIKNTNRPVARTGGDDDDSSNCSAFGFGLLSLAALPFVLRRKR